jgi:predicted nucleic acid-binding protein
VIRRAILDTGPLLALIDARDQHHAWAKSQFAKIAPPLLTCEAVLTEACHLAKRVDGGTHAVLDLFRRDVARVEFSLAGQFAEVSALVERWADVPMSLADACLVRMSELHAESLVFTLDSGFGIYRRFKRQRIPLLTSR